MTYLENAKDKDVNYSELLSLNPQKLPHLLGVHEEEIYESIDTAPMRFLQRARKIAAFLIDEKGDFKKENLKELLALFEQEGGVFFPFGTNDPFFMEQMQRTLKKVFLDEMFVKILRTFRVPVCNLWVEEILKASLGIFERHTLTTADLRRAVISACLIPLRQNIGSCFATAPAILVQREAPFDFLEDLYQLIFTGRLKRVFGGVEYAVPLSPSVGSHFFYEKISPLHLKGIEFAFKVMGLPPPPLNPQMTLGNIIHETVLSHFGLTEEEFSKEPVGILDEMHQITQIEKQALLAKAVEKKGKMAFCSVFDHSLLKAWEFTLASFSEIKMEFSSWNLYLGLGLNSSQPGGIGELLFNFLNEQLKTLQNKSQDLNQEYESAFHRMKASESLLKSMAHEGDIKRMQVELQGNLHHTRTLQEMRDSLYSLASHYVTLLPTLVKQYESLFPLYFQEIYDPDRMTPEIPVYEDSPAGFRLVYKHGRNDPSLWSLIHTKEEYVAALADFFTMTEPVVFSSLEWEEGKSAFEEINTAIITHIRSPLFIETAQQRIQRAYPGSASSERTPWSYTSGGTLVPLCKTYFRKEEFPEEHTEVETPTELAIFLIETLKNLPPKRFFQDRGILMASPSHAFILRPDFPLFFKAWQETGFTYTWVRDELFIPQEKFYEAIELSPYEQEFLFTKWSRAFPHLVFESGFKMGVKAFREEVLNQLPAHFPQQHFANLFDSFLYENLPLIKGEDVHIWIERLGEGLKWEGSYEEFYTSAEIKALVKQLYIQKEGKIAFPFDLHEEIEKRARLIGLSPPEPLIFADTNWATYFFAFLVNPGTSNLELWRVDHTGGKGYPMTAWQGSFGKDLPWTVYA